MAKTKAREVVGNLRQYVSSRRADPGVLLIEDAIDLIIDLSAPAMPDPTDHKWLDPECGVNGCQSLVWKSRYESAVRGRQDFRRAYRLVRKDNKIADGVLRAALKFLEGSDPLLISGGVRNMDLCLGIRAALASMHQAAPIANPSGETIQSAMGERSEAASVTGEPPVDAASPQQSTHTTQSVAQPETVERPIRERQAETLGPEDRGVTAGRDRRTATLVDATRTMVADHMTSEKHHPGYVLVPTAAFEMARDAIQPPPEHHAASYGDTGE